MTRNILPITGGVNTMDEEMTKDELLQQNHQERERFEGIIGKLTGDQMIESSMEEGWSVKDILAHIRAWETRMIQWLDQVRTGEIPEPLASGNTWDDLDEINQRTYEQNQEKSLSLVLSQFHTSFSTAVQAVMDTPEAMLIDPDYFEWREGRPFWKVVAENTCWHYLEHRNQIDSWMKGSETKDE